MLTNDQINEYIDKSRAITMELITNAEQQVKDSKEFNLELISQIAYCQLAGTMDILTQLIKINSADEYENFMKYILQQAEVVNTKIMAEVENHEEDN